MRRFSVTLILVMVLVGLQGAAFAKTKKKTTHATAAQTSHRTTTAHHKASAKTKPAAPTPEVEPDKKPK